MNNPSDERDHVAWQGNFEAWVQDPLHVRPIAHAIWDPHFGQPAVEACQKKRKSNISEASCFKTTRRRFCQNKNDEEEMNKGVSTTLRLYDDPWKIKKTLTDSDLGILSRLLLAADLVKKQILPMLGVDHARVAETEEGTRVRVWDMDTESMHQLVLKRWSSSKSYVLVGKWNQDFVRRRDLKKGDEIGFYWDPYNCVFNFCILKRAMPKN